MSLPLINIFIVLASLAFLVKGSDLFVKSAAAVARRLGVSELVIGLTLIAVGTSLPELVSSIFASLRHESSLVIGTILGANIANLGLIVGMAVIIRAIKTDAQMLKRDGYLLLFTAALFSLFILDGEISRLEGLVFLSIFVVYNFFLFEKSPKWAGRYHFREFARYFFGFHYVPRLRKGIASGVKGVASGIGKVKTYAEAARKGEIIKPEMMRPILKGNMTKDLAMLALSSAAVMLGANFLVDQAIFFARLFQIPAASIGVIMAIGTTMPEMSVAIAASRKGFGNIVMGNSIGSSIANTLLILGVSALIFPLAAETKLNLFFTGPYFIFMSLLLMLFIRSNWSISRKEGIALIALYLVFFLVLLLGPLLWG